MENLEEVAAKVLREFEKLSSNRGTWESHWTEIAERMFPAQANLFFANSMSTKGDKRTQEIYDSTAPIALTRFGSILDSLLTPRNQTWHRLVPSNPHLAKDRQVKLWFENLNRSLFKYRYAAVANFSSQNQQNYLSLGAYGTGCLFTDELSTGKGLRYKNVHLGEIYFAENHQGVVDKAYRVFRMTSRQMKQKWGKTIPEIVQSKLEKDPESEFEIVHCVKPREDDYDPSRKDHKGMLYASYYVVKEGQKLLEEKGYVSFPYAISRYTQTPGEIYGRSPAMDVLPAVKTLNEEKKTLLKQGHRALDPVLLAHDDGVVDGFSLRPGALNIGGVTSDGRPLVHALPTGNIAVGQELMQDERVCINDAFLISIFQILTENPQMTATEVMERTREKGILLAPTIGRQQTEYLGPLIDREIDILSYQGLIDPMPQILKEAQGEYRIEYDSPISRTQRAEESAGAQRTIEMAISVAAQTGNPEPLDHFDWDVIMPEIAEISGTPTRWLRSMDVIQKLRAGRAQAAQQQNQVNAAPAAAALIKAKAVARK